MREELAQPAQEVIAGILEGVLTLLEQEHTPNHPYAWGFSQYYHLNKHKFRNRAPGVVRMSIIVAQYAKRQGGEELARLMGLTADGACSIIGGVVMQPRSQSLIQQTLQRHHPGIYEELFNDA